MLLVRWAEAAQPNGRLRRAFLCSRTRSGPLLSRETEGAGRWVISIACAMMRPESASSGFGGASLGGHWTRLLTGYGAAVVVCALAWVGWNSDQNDIELFPVIILFTPFALSICFLVASRDFCVWFVRKITKRVPPGDEAVEPPFIVQILSAAAFGLMVGALALTCCIAAYIFIVTG